MKLYVVIISLHLVVLVSALSKENQKLQQEEIFKPNIPLNYPYGFPNQTPASGYQNNYVPLRPVGEHVQMKPPPVFDADVHFDEDVHYNVYKPYREHNRFPEVLTDQHVIPRPPVSAIQNQPDTVLSQGNHPNLPIQASMVLRPGSNQNANTNHMPLRPELFSQLPDRPPLSVLSKPYLPGYRPQHMMTMIEDQHVFAHKPLDVQMPRYVIVAKNVFINPPKGLFSGRKPGQWQHPIGTGNLGHNLRPDPVTVENNIQFLDMPKPFLQKEFFLNSLPKESLYKPYEPHFLAANAHNTIHSNKHDHDKPGMFIDKPHQGNMHPPLTSQSGHKPEEMNPLMSAIRFDHGRDHHVRPGPVTVENNIKFVEMPIPPVVNKDFFMTNPKPEWITKPDFPAMNIGNNLESTKPGNYKPWVSLDKSEYPIMGNMHPTLTNHGSNPGTDETENQFHPLLSPMTTAMPAGTPLSQKMGGNTSNSISAST